MSTSLSYVNTGRTQQKARTRQALVDAARSLLAEGVTPTVIHAAERAGVSRARGDLQRMVRRSDSA
jgi:hypothetical protein